MVRETVNKGRVFYCCDRPRDEQCGFFKFLDAWMEENGYELGGAASPPQGNAQVVSPATPAGTAPSTPKGASLSNGKKEWLCAMEEAGATIELQ